MEYFIVKERCSTIRTLAREGLFGNWKTGFLAILIVNLIMVTPLLLLAYTLGTGGAMMGLVYVIIVSGPLSLGLAIFALNIARGQEVQLRQIFYGFEQFGKAFGVTMMMAIFLILWGLSGISMTTFFATTIWGVDGGRGALFYLAWPIIIIAFIPAIIAALRYSQAYFILAGNPNMGVLEYISTSKTIMYGNKVKYFVLGLTFFGWALLAGLPYMFFYLLFTPIPIGASFFHILAIVIIPYMGFYFVELYALVSFAVLHDMIIGNLRPGTIQATAEIIEPQNMPPNMHPNEPQNIPPNETEESRVNHEMSTPHAQWTSEGYVPVNEPQHETEKREEAVFEDSRLRKIRERYQTKNDNQD